MTCFFSQVAYSLWMDRENIPQFMPIIDSVVLDKDDSRYSVWTLRQRAFEQEWAFTWRARNLTPLPNSKIHWVSEEGLRNKGAVRFYNIVNNDSNTVKQADSDGKKTNNCTCVLSISYEVPEILSPFANALDPLVQRLLQETLQSFKTYAEEQGRIDRKAPSSVQVHS